MASERLELVGVADEDEVEAAGDGDIRFLHFPDASSDENER